jgi:adenine-specific DNA-methyltransferase
VNYIGRKFSLLDFLGNEMRRRISPDCRVFFDVFAGTGVVGKHFKQQGFRVVANDIQYYAYCLNRAYLGLNTAPRFSEVPIDRDGPDSRLDSVLTFLNRLPGIEGFVFQHYCPNGYEGRMYFTNVNGLRCDAIRQRIESWRMAGQLTESEYFYLLAILIDGMDRVANTASVYAAFLKQFKASARKPLHLNPIPLIWSQYRHKAFNEDGADLIGRVHCDVLYMDPPYNQRQYCTNYHVLETIARYDRPEVYGLTGLRPHENQKSDFCRKHHALPTLDGMVRNTLARYVFLSYNSEGLMPKNDIIDTLSQYGHVEVVCHNHTRFRADQDRANRIYKTDRVEEFLFCLEKD